MEKYKIQSNHLPDTDKWQSAYLSPARMISPKSVEPPIKNEFIEERFDTKEEADNFALKHLMKIGVDKNNIEIL